MVALAPYSYQTTNAAGTFSIISDGGIAGIAEDDPAIRYTLRSGLWDEDETMPMYGGMGIYELVPLQPAAGVPSMELQCNCGIATAISGGAKPLSAIAVFNQNHSAVLSAFSDVPLVGSRMTFNYHRLQSGARISLAMDPVLVSLSGGLVGAQVSWDFFNQRLIPFQAAYDANVITAASWAATNGGEITFTTTTNHGLAVGSVIHISGMVPDAYNGTYVTKTGTATDQIVVAKTVDPGADTVQGQLDAGGGAFPCKINRVRIGNSMVPVFDPATGNANWIRNGSTALVQI